MQVFANKEICIMNELLVGSSIIAAGVGVLLWGLIFILRGMATHNWPSTTGQILESGFRDYNEPDNYGYTYHVKYQYSVQGVVHTGTRLRFGLGSYMNKETAERLIARYPVGGEVTVFHHPHKALSVLEKGFTSPTYFLLMVGGFVALAGVWMLSTQAGH